MTFTIPSGGTTSDTQTPLTQPILALITPAALTGTGLSFLVSQDNATFVPLHKPDGNLYSLTVAASRVTVIDEDYARVLSRFPYVQVKSNGTEAAARSIVAVTR